MLAKIGTFAQQQRRSRYGPIFGSGWRSRSEWNSVLLDRITFLTTLRDSPNSRQISLIGRPCAKHKRLILAIVSTTSIPTRPPFLEAQWAHSLQGALLDAYHPVKGIIIPCRFTKVNFHEWLAFVFRE
jgi:hypothetical protein